MKSKILTITFLILLIPHLQLHSQSAVKNLKITGKVIDQSNHPVKGAQLVVDNKPLKNLSGPGGKFTIKVPVVAARIGITFNERPIIDEPINGRSEITIVIPDSIHEKIKANAQISAEKSSDNDYSMYTTIYDLIRAKLPGVQVSGTNLKVRGTGSLTMDSQPLLVVNGSAVSSISDISPLDVASVNLLKGPDASIYGSRGANGVILIRLKKGQK